jgi:hypothetical protein
MAKKEDDVLKRRDEIIKRNKKEHDKFINNAYRKTYKKILKIMSSN